MTLFFGLRREEVLGLRWQAIDFKNKIMKINHTVTKGTTITMANTTKTVSSAREYPLTDEQIEMFQKLKDKEAKREILDTINTIIHLKDYEMSKNDIKTRCKKINLE